MKFGFLFGGGAEVGYGLPLGSKFALDIFRYDNTSSKDDFRDMRDGVNPTTRYAQDWLPDNYRKKSISAFGKKVFQNIIQDTVKHNRQSIVARINGFDSLAKRQAKRISAYEIEIDKEIHNFLGRKINNIGLGQEIKFIDEFKKGNGLFASHYFSAFLLIYKKKEAWESEERRKEFGRMILSVMQLHLGALSEDLTKRINEGAFEQKDDEIDLFDDLGDIIQLNYSEAGLVGLEYLLDMHEPDLVDFDGKIIKFLQMIIEEIYASVLDYKSLIDSNWHYLYNPKCEWAKFTKICIFLMTVRNYIRSKSKDRSDNPNGYYEALKEAIDKGLFEVTEIATTNYNTFIERILKTEVAYLNGSTDLWYDPYINKIGKEADVLDDESHIIVPLLFTQSGTKPMTAIKMSEQYVNTYRKWKAADSLIVIGFGFGADDEHINGIIRTLVDDDNKKMIVITRYDKTKTEDEKAEDIIQKLKIKNNENVYVIYVDKNGKNTDNKLIWTECLTDLC